jgi:hypothetical protein
MIAITDTEHRLLELKSKLDEIDTVNRFNATEGAVRASLLELDDEFKAKITEGYTQDPLFAPIIKTILTYYEANKDKVIEDMIERLYSPYKLLLSPENRRLLFYKDPVDDCLRLCLSKPTHREMFSIAHDRENHFGIAKTYARMITNYFVPYLFRTLKIFISRCP